MRPCSAFGLSTGLVERGLIGAGNESVHVEVTPGRLRGYRLVSSSGSSTCNDVPPPRGL